MTLTGKAELTAKRVLDRHRATAAPVDVEAMARAEGALVLREPLGKDVSGLLMRTDDATVLAVNSDRHPRRQRFTIAHELGHLLLHPGRTYTVDSTVRLNWRNDLSSLATSTEEIQANAFAAELLMPAKLLKQAIDNLAQSRVSNEDRIIRLLAEEFQVSTIAMQYRLVNLGIAS